MDTLFAIVILLVIIGIIIRILAWLYGRFRHKYDAYSDRRLDRKIERRKKQMELAHLEEDLRQKKEGFNLQFNADNRENKRLQIEEKRLFKEMSLELAKLNINSHNGEVERLQSMIGAMLNYSSGLSSQKHQQTMNRIEALRGYSTEHDQVNMGMLDT